MHVRGLVGDAVICVRRDCMQFHSSIGGEETLCFAAQFFSCRMPPGRTRKREDLRELQDCEPGSSASYRPPAKVHLVAGSGAQQVAPRSARATSYVSIWSLCLEEAKLLLAESTDFVSDSEEEARPRRQVRARARAPQNAEEK